MALTKIPRGLLDTGIADSSDATAITIDSSENATFAGDVLVNKHLRLRTTDDQTNQWYLYTHTDDTFRINYNAAGNDEIVVDTTGKVGIGDTSPFAKLHVEDTSWSSGSPYGAVAYIQGGAVNDLNWGHLLVSQSGTTTDTGGRISLGANGENPIAGLRAKYKGATYGDLAFLTRPSGGTNTERMLITSAGHMGFNTSSIQTFTNYTSYHFTPAGTTSTALLVDDENGASGRLQIFMAGSGYIGTRSNDDLIFTTNDTIRARISSAGTTTFEHPVVVQSGATQGYYIENNAGNAVTPRITNDANDWTIIRPGVSGGDVAINNYANTANRVIFTDEGKVGIGRAPDVTLEADGPLKITNNTAGGISQTHTNMTAANSGKLLINFGSIGTMTTGDTIVFTYAATSWKSWFFKIRWSSTGGYMGELWAGGYNNSSDGYQILNPRYYAAGSGDGSSNTTVEGATLSVSRSGQGNTMTLTLNNNHIHPLFEIEYACAGGEGYPNASKATLTVNS